MCPACNSVQFRRSQRYGTRERLYSWIKFGHFPYRCHFCGTRFWLSKKIADRITEEAGQAVDVPDATDSLQMKPLAFQTSEPALRKSQFQHEPRFRLRKWVWQHTHLEVETAVLFLILGTMILAGVWIAINQI